MVLCRAYPAVMMLSLSASHGCDIKDGVVRLLLGWGVRCDEQLAEFGVWQDSDCCTESGHPIGVDLLARGVERIGVLISDASDEADAALLRAFPGATIARPFQPLAQQVVSAAPGRARSAVAEGLERIRRAQSRSHADALLDALAASTWQGAPLAVQMCRAAIRDWAAVYSLPQRARMRVVKAEDAAWALQQGVSRALARHGPFESAHAAAAFAEDWLMQAGQRRRQRRLVLRHRGEVAAARAAG